MCIISYSTTQEWNRLAHIDNSINQNIALQSKAVSEASQEVAFNARKDGKQMKSLAFLGMIFLPATWVAVSEFHFLGELIIGILSV